MTTTMASATAPGAAVNTKATVKTTAMSRKREAGNSGAVTGCSSKRQATTPCRITRSRFKNMNKNNSTPESLNPGLEIKPRRRRAHGRGQQAAATATRPQDTIIEVSKASEKLENKPAPDSPTHKRASEADVAAASRLAQAAVKAGLTTGFPTGNTLVFRLAESREYLTEKDLDKDIAGVVDDVEATQDSTPPTQPDISSPSLSAFTPGTHIVDGESGDYHRGNDSDELCQVAASEVSPDLARVEAEEVAGADTEADSDEKPTTKQPTPWLPDKADNFMPRWEWSTAGEVHSRAETTVVREKEDKPVAISTPSFIRSGGVGSEIESPVQSNDPGSLKLTLSRQLHGTKAGYAAEVAQIVSPREKQALTVPLPPAVMQWEPDHHSVDGREYSPEVFEGYPEEFELEEWDDDVDP
ncbi:hypothetical protein VM1G_10515 [Cytospora mali]|uniref:Uncharacterized protein n=1 Tax=Cytospora mali TaxID=578113 RepID=A0A194VIA7_CYTMA|nr:hypothetical protein VM1G_10515 [Valsa mali]